MYDVIIIYVILHNNHARLALPIQLNLFKSFQAMRRSEMSDGTDDGEAAPAALATVGF